jgi:hypothetical protein
MKGSSIEIAVHVAKDDWPLEIVIVSNVLQFNLRTTDFNSQNYSERYLELLDDYMHKLP